MRALTVAKRLINQIIADKRSIALLFVAPIFVLSLLKIILTSSPTEARIAIFDIPNTISSKLTSSFKVETFHNINDALKAVEDNKLDGVISFESNKLKITIDGSSSNSKLVLATLQKNLSSSTQGNSSIKSEITYMNGSENMSLFDTIAPYLMGFFIFFFVFLIAGISFLRERISGTLERILSTPLRRWEIVCGYLLGFGLFVSIQTLVIQVFMIYGLGIDVKGSFWHVLVLNLILAAQSLSLGTLLSAFAQNEFQLFQFIPVVIVPQILFCGIFNISDAPTWVRVISKIFPLTYGAHSLNAIIIKGQSLTNLGIDVSILLSFMIVFVTLNTLALKKYRKI